MKIAFRQIKWWKYMLFILLFIFVLAWIFIARNDLRYSDAKVSTYFEDKQVRYAINRIDYDEDELRFISTGVDADVAETSIIFLHGAPGASDAFYSYLSDAHLVKKAHLVAVDRPGYGYSAYGKPMINILEQADAVISIINYIQVKKVLLVGHSYGTAVTGMIAARRPDLVIGNIMLASVIDPNEEKVFFFSSWPSLPILKHFFSGSIQVSSYEKMNHADELKAIEEIWSDTKVPTLLFHGGKDWIAPVANADYLTDKIDSDYLRVDIDDDANHFIVWENQEKVVQNILSFLDSK